MRSKAVSWSEMGTVGKFNVSFDGIDTVTLKSCEEVLSSTCLAFEPEALHNPLAFPFFPPRFKNNV